MDFSFFVKGFIIGFAIAAPVGPIGLLCIQRTIHYGRNSGLLTGLGASTADLCYSSIIAFGLTIVSGFLIQEQFWLKLIGGVFLLYLGIKIFKSKPSGDNEETDHKGLLSDYISTIFLTLINPITIFSFIAVFTGLGFVSSRGDVTSAILMVIGVFLGSVLWWFALSEGVSLFRLKFNAKSLRIVNYISGAIIITFSLYSFLTMVEI
jgi:threonine/homoserine/homoserine lactone efflux protein